MKFAKLFPKELTSKLKELLILREKDGSYKLFNRYSILVSSEGLYQVKILNDSENNSPAFSVLKHAVAWCTLEQRKKYKDTKRLEDLDLRLSSEDVEIELLKKKILNASDPDTRSIYWAKYYEHKIKKRAMLREIEQYVLDSKYWQSRKFKEAEPQVLRQNDKYYDKDWK